MTAAPGLRRNLAVQVRLAGGTLVLKLNDEVRSLKGVERDIWYRADEFPTRKSLLAAVSTGEDEELADLLDDIVGAGFLLTTATATAT